MSGACVQCPPAVIIDNERSCDKAGIRQGEVWEGGTLEPEPWPLLTSQVPARGLFEVGSQWAFNGPLLRGSFSGRKEIILHPINLIRHNQVVEIRAAG